MRACVAEWDAYCHHEFVHEVGRGTLPIESFSLLPGTGLCLFGAFFRAPWALAVYKSDSVEENAVGQRDIAFDVEY